MAERGPGLVTFPFGDNRAAYMPFDPDIFDPAEIANPAGKWPSLPPSIWGPPRLSTEPKVS